jgi:hypothetical protein
VDLLVAPSQCMNDLLLSGHFSDNYGEIFLSRAQTIHDAFGINVDFQTISSKLKSLNKSM